MRQAQVFVNAEVAGVLEELPGGRFRFRYESDYRGAPISLTMPIRGTEYEYERFPPFFEGLLPEGIMLEALLRRCKLDKQDYFGQLLEVGNDMVGAVTVKEIV